MEHIINLSGLVQKEHHFSMFILIYRCRKCHKSIYGNTEQDHIMVYVLRYKKERKIDK